MAFTEDGLLDPDKSVFAIFLGKKGTGKSKLARIIFESYPYDRAILDVNGTDRPSELDDPESGYVELDHVPDWWPEHLRFEEKPLTLYYKPDAGSDTFSEDQDKFIGMCFEHGRMCILIHEMGILAPAHRTQKHTRRMLHQGRHKDLTVLMCAPRPVTMDPLAIAQSDFVYVFKLPNPADRKRVADVIGWEPEDFDLAVMELEEHGYLRYDDSADEESDMKLIAFEAVPEDELPAATS